MSLPLLHLPSSTHRGKANDGEGSDIFRSAPEGNLTDYVEPLAATLAEHLQQLASIQVLINPNNSEVHIRAYRKGELLDLQTKNLFDRKSLEPPSSNKVSSLESD